jgi:hypothetical protein
LRCENFPECPNVYYLVSDDHSKALHGKSKVKKFNFGENKKIPKKEKPIAERQLYLQNNFQKVDQNSIKQHATKIYQTSPPYHVICWLISEIDFFLKRNYFKNNQKPHFILD